MHRLPIICTIVFAFAWPACALADGPSFDESIQLFGLMNTPDLPHEARWAAEDQLRLVEDFRFLEVLLRSLDAPVGQWESPEAVAESYLSSGTPRWRAYEAEMFLPEVQIVSARLRLWEHLSTSMEPAEERGRVIAELFDRVKTNFQLTILIGETRRNWNAAVREALLAVYQDGDVRLWSRYSAAHTLLDMRHATPRGEQEHIAETIYATAWQERSSPFATQMGRRLSADDPRSVVLKLDWYEHQLEQAVQSNRLPMMGTVNQIDGAFGNITGEYRNPRAALTEAEREHSDNRHKLMQEARETGDDTKLREFEAEVAAKQQSELELRIERIDAWIDENRDRLEQEAEEYHRERMREQQEDD